MTASATGIDDTFDAFVAKTSPPGTPEEAVEYAQWRVRNSSSPIPGLFEEKVAGGSGLLTNPLGAEYQTVLIDHGPYDPDTYDDDQWTMHDGGCHVGEENTCSMLQAAGAFGLYPWSS